jgi:hypothetical protein
MALRWDMAYPGYKTSPIITLINNRYYLKNPVQNI